MRFVAALLFFYLLTALPCLDIYIKWYRRGTHLIARKALWLIPVAMVVPLSVLQHATDFSRVSEWYLWALLTVTFTANVYMLFDLIARYTGAVTSRVLRCVGGTLAIVVLAVFLAGMIRRHDIKVRHTTVRLNHLPASFDGMRIAHITDLHLGNLTPQHSYLQEIVDTINALQPDMICFTGDLVHLSADDSAPSDTILRRMQAPLGKYAVLGNHDYGDYVRWQTPQAKAHNLLLTKTLYRRLGFTLLCDSAVYITHQATGSTADTIGLIGVENWGKEPFPKYGDLRRATDGYVPAAVNLLLSHDPDHWQGEVIPSYPWIDLTLSGHTHGAQLGIECGQLKISPSQWIFTHWDGLYTRGNQHLYISRGLGYVGIPFRFGMYPEVSIITLRTADPQL